VLILFYTLIKAEMIYFVVQFAKIFKFRYYIIAKHILLNSEV